MEVPGLIALLIARVTSFQHRKLLYLGWPDDSFAAVFPWRALIPEVRLKSHLLRSDRFPLCPIPVCD